MLPPRLRDRTVRPNTWPMVFTTRVSGMFSVVVTIIGRDGDVLGLCLHGLPPLTFGCRPRRLSIKVISLFPIFCQAPAPINVQPPSGPVRATWEGLRAGGPTNGRPRQ